jgi:hypothetical protein
MAYFRPFSVVAIRVPTFFDSLTQPLLDKKKEATESLGNLSLFVQHSFWKTYIPPAYIPARQLSKIERLKGNF